MTGRIRVHDFRHPIRVRSCFRVIFYNISIFTDIAGALVGVGLIVNSETMPGVLALDKDYNNMSKFLNRILGMPVDLQNRLFKYFTDTLQAIIAQAKKSGRFDLGILGNRKPVNML